MSLAGESQLSFPAIPDFLDEKIVSIVFPLSIYEESAIGRPTGLFTAPGAFGHDFTMMCVEIVYSDLKPFSHSRRVGNLVPIGRPCRIIVITRTERDASHLGLVTFNGIHDINLRGSGS